MAITNKYAKNFQNGSTYYDWKAHSTSSWPMGCGYYSSSNFVFCIKFTITERPYQPLRIRLAMTSDGGFGDESVTWNYKFFTSESDMNNYKNASTSTKGDGTVTWNKGDSQVTTLSFDRQFAVGTHYVAFWRTTQKGCEIRWCNSGGSNWCDVGGDTMYKLSFTGDAGYNSASNQGYHKSGSSVSVVITSKTGYTIKNQTGTKYDGSSGGIWTDGAGTTSVTTNWSIGTHDRSVYVNTNANTYTVKYNGNGNTGGSTASSSHTYGTAKALTANGFTKTGYIFSGWATSASGSKAYSDKQSVSNLTATNGGTVNLYAVWSANKYTVGYNANGGSGSMATDTVTYGAAYKTKANTFTRTGYTFVGWNEKADGSGSDWTSWIGKDWTWSYTKSIILYAQWKANTYTVKYNGNGNTGGSTASSSHTYGTAKALTANGFTKTGYIFSGWATSASGSKAYSDKQSVSNLTATNGGTVNLYAVWSANDSYELTIDPNGGTYKGSTGLSYVTNLSFDAYYEVNTPPTRTGYSFLGWKSSGSGNILSGSANSITDGITQTQKTDIDGAAYTNYKFSKNNTGTTTLYYGISFFNYNFTAGHTYQVSYDIRVNSISNISWHLRHCAFSNNWDSPSNSETDTDIHEWQHKTLSRTFQSTTTQSGTTYTTDPCVEALATLFSEKNGSFDIDIKNIYVYDMTSGSYATSKNNVKNGATFYIQGNTTIQAIWEANGLVYIDNGSSFDAYQVFIDNGSSWDQYIPYVDNGTSWDILS